MRPYLRLFLCLPLLATTACAADAIAGPELAPEPEMEVVAQVSAEPEGVKEATPAIGVLILSRAPCCACSLRPQATEPMYIVDGVVVLSLAGLDNDDIVSIEVLKSTVASALYGTRAARGAIIITTRSGVSLRG
jgi:TonB-dependent SusC/RagA subfamily outer membrane receptor